MITAAQYRTIVASKQSESDIQILCVRWFRLQYPEYAKLLFAIPNGGSRSHRINAKGKRYSPEGKKLKDSGVLPGIPDLFLAKPNRWWSGLFIEMKNWNGIPSTDQRKMLSEFKKFGYATAVCRSVDEFEQVVKQYLQ